MFRLGHKIMDFEFIVKKRKHLAMTYEVFLPNVVNHFLPTFLLSVKEKGIDLTK